MKDLVEWMRKVIGQLEDGIEEDKKKLKEFKEKKHIEEYEKEQISVLKVSINYASGEADALRIALQKILKGHPELY